MQFQSMMSQWARNKVTAFIEREAKSMPAHVTEVAKDFIKVAFETQNGIFAMPIVKMAQQFSQFSREPTQMGNKGYAVPGNYYMGGVTGDSGGNTSFYPRGNLATLAFNPVSHTQNRERDYDQLTHMGGPNGWNIGAFTKQAGDNDGSQNQGNTSQVAAASVPPAAYTASGRGLSIPAPISLCPTTKLAAIPQNVQVQKHDRARRMNIERTIMAKSRGVSIKSLSTPIIMPRDSSGGGSSSGNGSGSGQQQSQQPSDKTTYNFDKNGTCTVQSKDTDHNVTVDGQGKKITLNLPVGEWGYAGGDGSKGSYARIMTEKGPSVNFKARIG
jgi:hypothetical protein